jgi:hypothetical protein
MSPTLGAYGPEEQDVAKGKKDKVEPEAVLEDEAPAEPTDDLGAALGADAAEDLDSAFDVDLSTAGREAIRGAAEGLKRAVSSGIRTVLAADETLRETLPRELPAYVARQFDATRKDLVDAIAQQTRVFFESVDLGAEVKRHLSEGRLEITTSIRFVPDEPADDPADEDSDAPAKDAGEETEE